MMSVIKRKKDFPLKGIYEDSTQLLNHLLEMRREKNYAFRGISRCVEYQPTIQRFYLNKKLYNLNDYEYHMLYEFYSQWNMNRFISSENILELISNAQHFGIPTRLIDWTRDPFVALYFSINENAEPDEGFYRLIYADLNEQTVLDKLYVTTTWGDLKRNPDILYNYFRFLRTIGDTSNLKKQIEERTKDLTSKNVKPDSHYNPDGLIFYEAPFSNDRILAQKGLFSVPTSLEGDDAEADIKKHTEEVLIKLTLNERTKLLEYLENMNYSRNYLFPDLQNLCRHIVYKTIKMVDD